jgi:hypothetical protein
MQDYQQRTTAFLDSFPRSEGLTVLLQAMVPVAARQWARVGRVVAVWRAERTDDSPELRARRVDAAAAQFSALRKALEETAQAEGLTLRPEPEIVPFVWSGLMGLADLLAQGWVEEIDWDRLTDLTVTSIMNQIVDSPGTGA